LRPPADLSLHLLARRQKCKRKKIPLISIAHLIAVTIGLLRRRKPNLAATAPCSAVASKELAAGIARRCALVGPSMKAFSDPERQNFLADKHVGVLSVEAADGRPPASVPIWYDYAPGGHVLINTGASSRKARLMQQAGKVTLVVQREEPPYQYVIVEGTVTDVTSPTPPEIRNAIAIRYLGEEGGRAFVAGMSDIASVLFTVRPDRWITADYSGA
jgi:PPOX class probable F420-dependent enzyme